MNASERERKIFFYEIRDRRLRHCDKTFSCWTNFSGDSLTFQSLSVRGARVYFSYNFFLFNSRSLVFIFPYFFLVFHLNKLFFCLLLLFIVHTVQLYFCVWFWILFLLLLFNSCQIWQNVHSTQQTNLRNIEISVGREICFASSLCVLCAFGEIEIYISIEIDFVQ